MDDSEVKELLSKGRFNEALQKVEIFQKNENLSAIDQLRCQVFKSQILTRIGRFEEGLKIAEKVLEECQDQNLSFLIVDASIATAEALESLGMPNKGLKILATGSERLSALGDKDLAVALQKKIALLHFKGCFYQQKGEFDVALKYFQESLALCDEIGSKSDISLAQNGIGTTYWRKGELDKALKYFQTSLALRQEVGNKQDIAGSLNNIGNIHWQRGDLDQALECYQESLALREEVGNKQHIAMSLNNIGNIYDAKGELSKALEFHQRSLALREELGNKQHIAMSLNNLGAIYWLKGDLVQALDHFNQSLAIRKELGNEQDIAGSLHNIGETYKLKGDLDEALQAYQESLAIFEKLGNKLYIAVSFLNIGAIFHQKGDLEQALQYLEQSLALSEEIGNRQDIAEVLFRLISLAIDRSSLEQAQNYLQDLQQINAAEQDKLINQYYRIAKALLLKTSTRIRDKAKAEELLEQVAKGEIIHHELTIEALLNLCDLHLVELHATSDQNLLAEVKDHVKRLMEVAKQQHSHWLLAEAYVLQSKIALVELRTKEARRSLTQAQFIAEEKGLTQLAMKISSDHDALLGQLSQWEKLVARKASLKERLDLTQLDDFLSRMVRKEEITIPEQPPEEPVMLLIVAENGLSVFSQSFLPESRVNDHLIGSFLSAVTAFGSEILEGTETIDRIMYQEHTLAMKLLENLMFCYVFKGQSYSALQKLDQFMETIHDSPSIWDAFFKTVQTGKMLQASENKAIGSIAERIFPVPHSVPSSSVL
ncbi:MAG: tetratricopeptide repeat protein [Candidatus Thorarchaeota archaeon]